MGHKETTSATIDEGQVEDEVMLECRPILNHSLLLAILFVIHTQRQNQHMCLEILKHPNRTIVDLVIVLASMLTRRNIFARKHWFLEWIVIVVHSSKPLRAAQFGANTTVFAWAALKVVL